MKKLAIISPNKFKYSETFIHAHVRELPFEKVLLHGGYLPHFASAGLEGGDVQLRQEKRWWKREVTAENAVRRFLERENVEVALAEYGPSGVACMEVCAQANVPLVVHFHGYDAYRKDILEEQGKRYPDLFERAAAVVVVSHDMERQVRSLGCPAEKVKLVPYGVDSEAFSPCSADKNPPHLVTVGRFTAKKGPLLTLEAFGRVLEEFPEATLEMIGDGELWEAAKAKAADLGIEGSVTFPGRKSPMEIAQALRGARAFVQHSLRPPNGDSEGLPLSILEAMATALPIVSTHHAGIPDAVRHDLDGLLSPEKNAAAMASHLFQVLDDPQLAARLGQSGRIRVERLYTRERYLRELAQVITEST